MFSCCLKHPQTDCGQPAQVTGVPVWQGWTLPQVPFLFSSDCDLVTLKCNNEIPSCLFLCPPRWPPIKARAHRSSLSLGSPPTWISLLLWYSLPCCPFLCVCDSLSLGPESIINCFSWASLLSPFVATPYRPLKEHSIHRSQTISKSLVFLHSALSI